jgi:hypothetical protein
MPRIYVVPPDDALHGVAYDNGILSPLDGLELECNLSCNLSLGLHEEEIDVTPNRGVMCRSVLRNGGASGG